MPSKALDDAGEGNGAFSQETGRPGCKIDESRGHAPGRFSSIQDRIDIEVPCRHFLGSSRRRHPGRIGRGRGYGACDPREGQGQRMGRYAKRHLSRWREKGMNMSLCLKDRTQGSGPESLQKLLLMSAYLGDLQSRSEVRYQHDHPLRCIPALDAHDPLDPAFVSDARSETVKGFGRVGDSRPRFAGKERGNLACILRNEHG